MDEHEIDDILGITRCVRCGHRLDGEVECPFCAALPDLSRRDPSPKWIYLTACFLTSPFSLYFILKTERLNAAEKLFSFSGFLVWIVLFGFWF